jgi:hypothetical protein
MMKLSISLALACMAVQVSTAQTTSKPPITLHSNGSITPDQIFSFVYAPFNVTSDVTSIYVLQNYSYKNAGNALDLGIFDAHGISAINSETGFSGSRGWSGGFRNNFTISAWDATPGYNAGPLLPGTWNVVLGPYATNRSGIDWTLDIILSYDTPISSSPYWSPALAPLYQSSFPTSPNQSLTSQWLRGDFHMHSIYSDGRYLPSQQIAHALSYNLDFIFFSEHNTDSLNNNVARWIPSNASDLLIGRAIEVTTRHGHWQAIGLERQQQVEWRYTNASNDAGYFDAATQVRLSGGLVSINHPFETCSRCNWTLDWDHNDAMEVWNGRFDDKDQQAITFWQSQLVAGRRVIAIGGSDAHSPPDINGLPTTVVRVEGEKSQASIVQGVKMGRVYIVEGPGMGIDFALMSGSGARVAEIGDTYAKTELTRDIVVSLVGKGFAGANACFINEKGCFHNATVTAQAVQQSVAGMEFVRVEVRNGSDVLLGMSNPIFFA